MKKIINSKAYCFGDDIKALEIMPIRFKTSVNLDPEKLAKAAFADIDPSFASKAIDGEFQIVVAGENFGGGGKSIEGPIFTLKGAGVQLVIAESFARYFLRNAINNGLPIIVCPGITQKVNTGDELEVDLDSSIIINKTTGVKIHGQPLSGTALEIMKDGGLTAYAKKKLAVKAD